jgi:hypothetical protein
MASIAEALEAKRETSNRLEMSLDRQAVNQRATTELLLSISELERQQTQARKAKALGQVSVAEPDAATIAESKLDLEGRQAAAADLASVVTRAKAEHAEAENRVLAAARETLNDNYRAAALIDASAILQALFEQAQKLIAIDGLEYYTFRDPDGNQRNWRTLEERFGPAAQIIGQIQRLDWGTYPYSLRPDWAPKATPPIVAHLPGVQEAKTAILRELGLEGLV